MMLMSQRAHISSSGCHFSLRSFERQRCALQVHYIVSYVSMCVCLAHSLVWIIRCWIAPIPKPRLPKLLPGAFPQTSLTHRVGQKEISLSHTHRYMNTQWEEARMTDWNQFICHYSCWAQYVIVAFKSIITSTRADHDVIKRLKY